MLAIVLYFIITMMYVMVSLTYIASGDIVLGSIWMGGAACWAVGLGILVSKER